MDIKKSTLSTAIIVAMGGVSLNAQAALTVSASLSFDPGAPVITACQGSTGGSPATGCSFAFGQITDMGGSYFRMNQGGAANLEKTPISMFAPIHIGGTQTSSGQHTGTVTGSESPAIDNAWNFFNNTGLSSLTSPVTVISSFGSTKILDFSGWGVNWGNFGPGGLSGPTIPMGGLATIVCSTSSCSNSSTYTLDMDVHVPVAFASVPYSLHLTGKVSSVPVPAAAWLFGSGIVGLAGVARRRRNKA